MLAHLSINNLAIIDDLSIPLQPGLTVISGETGAGKSILINAANLILGGRASSELIRTGCREARVEALFILPENSPMEHILDEMDIPFEGELLIKRTMSQEGRNRVFINGAMATLQMLSAVGGRLMSVSGQHEYQLLLKPENHLFLLDEFAALSGERQEVSDLYKAYQRLCKDVETLGQEISRCKAEKELSLFQMEEIETASPSPGEDLELNAEKKRIQSSEELKKTAEEAFRTLYEDPESITSSISQCLKRIERGAAIEKAFAEIAILLQDAAARIEDAAFTLRGLKERLHYEPARLDQIMERLEILARLKRKYGPTIEDILKKKDALKSLEREGEEKESVLKELLARQEETERRLVEASRRLSDKRKKAALEMEKAVEMELDQLHLKAMRFKVIFQDRGSEDRSETGLIGPDGMDHVEFLMAANIGEDIKPLSRIASGGELSRIMLALKTILAGTASIETVVFDEVDSGISGAEADVVGEKLLTLSRFHQVICITHLPQIASKGLSHYLVRKEIADERTRTTVSSLNPDERVLEIARLLGGREITRSALEHARGLLGYGLK
ncbi:MAG: DNA repair protein RecN [Deltaproteobacteria bacterium CG_4_9_14_3_um_filter_51_14]|nr:MAG: DNA repair protein RecN [Deltaproteobacteria bacterium CG_4_9_14_3_um_filter_51_14]